MYIITCIFMARMIVSYCHVPIYVSVTRRIYYVILIVLRTSRRMQLHLKNEIIIDDLLPILVQTVLKTNISDHTSTLIKTSLRLLYNMKYIYINKRRLRSCVSDPQSSLNFFFNYCGYCYIGLTHTFSFIIFTQKSNIYIFF